MIRGLSVCGLSKKVKKVVREMIIFWLENHSLLKRAISMVALVAFMVSFVLSDAWAAIETPGRVYQASLPSQTESPLAVLDVDTFSIPAHLGEVIYLHRGTSPRTVVHIQDAHCNFFAQKKVSEIIDYLTTEYGIEVVNLEGGAGEYDLTPFTSISNKEIRSEVSEHFVKTGDINGAEYFAVNHPDKVTLWGIEDPRLYMDNLKVYRNSLKYKSSVDEALRNLTQILNKFKQRIYSKDLLKIDMAYNAFKTGNMPLKDYVEFLVLESKREGIDPAKFKNIEILMKTMKLEEKIDFSKATRERNILLDLLKRKASKNDLKKLVTKTVEFKTRRITPKEFYTYLINKARFTGIDTGKHQNLNKYITYVTLYEEIDRNKVMDEVDEMENELKEKLYTSDVERELNARSKNLALMKNMFDFRLIKKDYDYYLKNKKAFRVKYYEDFILEEAPEYNIAWRPDRNLRSLDGHLRDISTFYRYSFERDKAFLSNMRFSFPEYASKSEESRQEEVVESAILMTGGFHADNLCELLEEEDVSYVSIMPKFQMEEGYESPYFDLLAGDYLSNTQRMLRSVMARAATLALASKLSSLGVEVWGREDIDAFDMAIALDARMRELKRDRGVERLGLILVGRDGRTVQDNEKDVVFTFDEYVDEEGELTDEIEAVDEISVAELLAMVGKEEAAPDLEVEADAAEEKVEEEEEVGVLSEAATRLVEAGRWKPALVIAAIASIVAFRLGLSGASAALLFLLFSTTSFLGTLGYGITESAKKIESETKRELVRLGGVVMIAFSLFSFLGALYLTNFTYSIPDQPSAEVTGERLEELNKKLEEQLRINEEQKVLSMAMSRYRISSYAEFEQIKDALVDLALGEVRRNIEQAYNRDPDRWKSDEFYRVGDFGDVLRTVTARFYIADVSRQGKSDFLRDGRTVSVLQVVYNEGQFPFGEEERKKGSWFFPENRPAYVREKIVPLIQSDVEKHLKKNFLLDMSGEPTHYHAARIERPAKFSNIVEKLDVVTSNITDKSHTYYRLKEEVHETYGIKPSTPVFGGGSILGYRRAQVLAAPAWEEPVFRGLAYLALTATQFSTVGVILYVVINLVFVLSHLRNFRQVADEYRQANPEAGRVKVFFASLFSVFSVPVILTLLINAVILPIAISNPVLFLGLSVLVHLAFNLLTIALPLLNLKPATIDFGRVPAGEMGRQQVLDLLGEEWERLKEEVKSASFKESYKAEFLDNTVIIDGRLKPTFMEILKSFADNGLRVFVGNRSEKTEFAVAYRKMPLMKIRLSFEGDYVDLESIFVSSAIGGKGYGARLAKRLCEYLKARGFEKIRVIPTGDGIAFWKRIADIGPKEGELGYQAIFPLEELITRLDQYLESRVAMPTPAELGLSEEVSAAEVSGIVKSWQSKRPDGGIVTYDLRPETLPSVLEIVNRRSARVANELKGNPYIILHLCLIYEAPDFVVSKGEKGVDSWIDAYFTRPEFKEPQERKAPLEGLSWSTFFDSMNSTPVRDSSTLSLIPYIEYAVREGVKNIEIPFDHMAFASSARLGEEFSSEELDEVRELCNKYGISITVHSPLIGPNQIFEDPADNMSFMKRQIERAGRMGADIMVVHLVSLENYEKYAELVNYASRVAPGLKIAFENYKNKNGVFPTAEEFMDSFERIVDKVAPENLNNIGIVVDTAHLNLTNKEDPVIAARIIAGRASRIASRLGVPKEGLISELHINQNMGPIEFYFGYSDDLHTPASTEGPIDNMSVIAALRLEGFRPMVTFEQMDSITEGDRMLLERALELSTGDKAALIERGKAVLEELQKIRDYKGFIATQVAKAKDLDVGFETYYLMAGMLGRVAFRDHIRRRVYQMLLTSRSEEEFKNIKEELLSYGLMPLGVDLDYANDGDVVIGQGADVDLSRPDFKAIHIVLEGELEGRTVWGNEFKVEKGEPVGEIGVLAAMELEEEVRRKAREEGKSPEEIEEEVERVKKAERNATVHAVGRTVTILISAGAVKELKGIMPNFSSVMNQFAEDRERKDRQEAELKAAERPVKVPDIARLSRISGLEPDSTARLAETWVKNGIVVAEATEALERFIMQLEKQGRREKVVFRPQPLEGETRVQNVMMRAGDEGLIVINKGQMMDLIKGRFVGTEKRIVVDLNYKELKEDPGERKELYELSGQIQDLFFGFTQSKFMEVIRSISGNETVEWEDIDKTISIDRYMAGGNKHVFRANIRSKSGEELLSFTIATKIEKRERGIPGTEIKELKRLQELLRKVVPRLGDSRWYQGKRWYLEEFIEGPVVRELIERGELTVGIRRKIISTLLAITVGLGGMMPRDFHPDNFIVQLSDGEAIMVDIGSDKFTIIGKRENAIQIETEGRHRMLMLAALIAEYGFPEGRPEDNYFIFDAIINDESIPEGEGESIMRDAYSLVESGGVDGLVDEFKKLKFRKHFRNIFIAAGVSRTPKEDVRQVVLRPFAEHFAATLRSYMAKADGERAPPEELVPSVQPGAVITFAVPFVELKEQAGEVTEKAAAATIAVIDMGEEIDTEKMLRQMIAAEEVAAHIENDRADFIMSPASLYSKQEKDRVDNEMGNIYDESWKAHGKGDEVRSFVKIMGYTIDPAMTEEEFKENFKRAVKKLFLEMMHRRYQEKDKRAIIFMPAQDNYYDIARGILDEVLDEGLAGVDNKVLQDLVSRTELVKEENMPLNGMINEVHHCDMGREFLDYVRLLAVPEEARDADYEGEVRETASKLVTHLKTIALDPTTEVLEGDPIDVINNFLNGRTALPAMEEYDLGELERVHEALLEIRRSL